MVGTATNCTFVLIYLVAASALPTEVTQKNGNNAGNTHAVYMRYSQDKSYTLTHVLNKPQPDLLRNCRAIADDV